MSDRDRVEYDPDAAIAELRAALGTARMTLHDLWVAYVSVGGDMAKSEFTATFAGSSLPDELQYQLISEALNEHFRGHDPVVA